MVAYFHIDLGVSEGAKSRNYTMLVENSYALVDLFFVLSGFIMAYVYWNAFSKIIRREACVNYFIARFSRIYPLHIATLIFMISLFIYSRGFSALAREVDNIIQNIFLIHAWGLSDQFVFNFPSWSVSVELFAYLLFPVIIVLARRRSGTLFLCAVVLALYLFMFFYLGTFHVDERLALVRGIPSFIVGILVFRVKALTQALGNTLISMLQVVCLFVIVLLLHFDQSLFFVLALFPLLVLILWEDRGILAKILSGKPIVYLGSLSYSIYLLHVPIRNSLHYAFPKIGLNATQTQEDMIFVTTAILLTIACSVLAYHFFEKPSRDGLKKILRQWVRRFDVATPVKTTNASSD